MADSALIILDAGQFSIRCRSCHWSSAGYLALASTRAAFQAHRCPAHSIDTNPTRGRGGGVLGWLMPTFNCQAWPAGGSRPAGWPLPQQGGQRCAT
jgi:hypothetical protein